LWDKIKDMEINNESKANFLSQYVGYEGQYGNTVCILTYAFSSETEISILIASHIPAFYMILKPLSSISDEDALGVASIFLSKSVTKKDRIFYGKSFIKSYADKGVQMCFHNIHETITAADYLRSRGYALPWNGITIEQQIAAGWVRLVNQ